MNDEKCSTKGSFGLGITAEMESDLLYPVRIVIGNIIKVSRNA